MIPEIVQKIPSRSNYDPEGVCYGNMIWYLGNGKTRVAGSVLCGCNNRIYIPDSGMRKTCTIMRLPFDNLLVQAQICNISPDSFFCIFVLQF
jgi:hypothetical protein